MSFGGGGGGQTEKPKEVPYIGGPLDSRSGLAGGHADVVSEKRRTKEEARRAGLSDDERGKLGPLAPITKGESLVRNQRLRTSAFKASNALGVL